MRLASRFVSGCVACGMTAVTCSSALAGSSSVAQCDSCDLAPATYSEHADGNSSNDLQSTVGPYINLTSAGAQSVAGELDSEPWPGPGISDQTQNNYRLNAILRNCTVIRPLIRPNSARPQLWDGEFTYEAQAEASSGGFLVYQLYVGGKTPTVGVLVKANGLVDGSPNLGDTAQAAQSIFKITGPGVDIYDAGVGSAVTNSSPREPKRME
jgi:hypothetical protein